MCIIGKMEQQYSPSKINNMSNDKFRDILYNIVEVVKKKKYIINKMDMDKIIIIIIVLLVTALVLYLCLRKKQSKLQPLQPWTGDQLARSLDLLRSMLPPNMALDQNLLKCLVSELSRKMSFQDFVNQNNKQRLESVNTNLSNCRKPLQPWTGDQLGSSLDLLRSMLPPNMASDQNLLECLLSELSRKMSFTDFVNKNNEQRLESVLGVKGNWSGCMNKFFMSFMNIPKELNLSIPCISCVAGKLEQNYSPIDIIKMNKDGSISDIFMKYYDSCKPPCV